MTTIPRRAREITDQVIHQYLDMRHREPIARDVESFLRAQLDEIQAQVEGLQAVEDPTRPGVMQIDRQDVLTLLATLRGEAEQ